MSSLKLLSASRFIATPGLFLLPALRTTTRYLSNTPSLTRPPMTREFPRVSNTAEKFLSKDRTWYNNSNENTKSIGKQASLNPYSGRTVNVHRTVSDSLKVLDGILSRNKVKLQLKMTERHEKKGYKRRRLESERWRNQFASEVRKKVQLVMKMRDRGA